MGRRCIRTNCIYWLLSVVLILTQEWEFFNPMETYIPHHADRLYEGAKEEKKWYHVLTLC